VSVLRANCPSCAATIVLVCPFCRSAVARTDRGLNDLGKVAEIVESQSPLRLGLKGEWRGHRFELTGRAQLRHEMGGFWDEWYATFSNGWVGWLAEAQGRFYLTFYQKLPQGAQLPPFERLQLGQSVPQIPGRAPLMVAEKGTATAIAADGEIPYRLIPNEQSQYADLAGANNAFGTIDYGMNPPVAFVGEQVTLADLGLANARPAERAARTVSTAAMGCPNCGGQLNLIAPDKAERVTCPNCDSLLEVSQGNLKWLNALKPSPDAHKFDLEIGMKGAFKDGVEMTIIGAVVRSVRVEGVHYYWHEYLLYNPQIGFRWLVHSDNHWNYVEPVNPAEVVSYGNAATYNGQTFKIFQDAPARVEYVKGEFYWRVQVGEVVRAIDYVKPPLVLSCERTRNEMNWSLGTYMTVAEIEKIFGVENLPKPWAVGPNQPFTGGFYIKYGFALLGLLCIVAIFMIPLGGRTETVWSNTLALTPTAGPNVPQTVFSPPFELKGNRNVRITASAPVDNSYASLDIDLINEQNNAVESVPIDIEFYSGVESGEAWSEGSKTSDVTVSSLPAGKYSLRVEGTWQNYRQPLPVALKVEQNVTRGMNFCCAFFLLAIVPLFSLLRWWMFESRRWSESMFGSSSSSGGSDDSD
jgi:hypothetical protein